MERNTTQKGNNTQEKARDAQCNCSPAAERCPSSNPRLPANSPLFLYWAMTFHGMELAFWLVGVSCPACAPSQLLVHLLASRAWESENSLT